MTQEQRLIYGADHLEFAKTVMLQLLRVGLAVSIASDTSKIVIIDADSYVHTEPEFQKLLDVSKRLGHTVYIHHIFDS